MGFLDNIFNDDKKKAPNKNNKNNNNPLANIRKNLEQMGKPKTTNISGPGYSLGGSKPGEVFQIVLPNPGSLGVRVEQRSNNSASAIVNTVVQGSQAEQAGLQRGDVLCFAGSQGQNEMPYSMFLEMAKSKQRPLHLEARRFNQKTAAATSGGSADAEARRRAMIAAAEAREKKHKSQTKTIKHVTKSTLLKQQQQQTLQQQQQLQQNSMEPQSEASRRAAEAAKRGEADLAAELGYNPYEAIKKTAGQARTATTTTQHGAISGPSGGASIPTVAPPSAPVSEADSSPPPPDPRFPYREFEEALATIVASSNSPAAKSGLKISKKLIVNATTKGQQPGEASEKFRRVRLANPKIKAAIVDVPGNLPLMLSVGFELHPDDANPDESLLVFPPGLGGPKWLSSALQSMEQTEKQLAA